MSIGDYRVGTDCNPSQNAEIDQVKGVTATLISNLEESRTVDPEINRLISLAQTKYEEAVMFAVKALAYRMKPLFDVTQPKEI